MPRQDQFFTEKDAMAIDAKRVQAIFMMAVEAADPAQQAAILDRECASDPELRERVVALLRSDREPPALVDQPTAIPFDDAPTSMGITMAIDSSAEKKEPALTLFQRDPVSEQDGSGEQEEQPPLEFLEPSPTPGSLGRLGHHDVLEVLGRGGFGIVVRAFDETLHRVVAIKVLSPQLAATSPARKRFLREARASARVRHRNVVQIHAVEEKPLPYLVMEFIPGMTLQQRLDQSGPLDIPDILRIGGQIARGLAAAHEQGLIHRDIKPGNILLESGIDQNVKITDFGLARTADDASISQSGLIAGTPLFMAPEQAKGEPLDSRADLFSLGSVLYTMASGRPPFRAATPLAVLKRVAEDTPRPIRQIIPEVPPWLCDIISRLHAKDPAQRFQTAAEVAALLEQHLAHILQPSLVAQPMIEQAPRQQTRYWVAGLAVAGVLGVLSAAVTYSLRPPGRPTSVSLVSDRPGDDGGQAEKPAAEDAIHSSPEPPRTLVLQGRSAVRDALIDFLEPDRSFGAAARDNALRRADQCNAFLVHFDLAKLPVPAKARVTKATVSFYVWDPSSMGKTKVSAFPLKTAWDEVAVTWREPAVGKSWQGGKTFSFAADAGPPRAAVVVMPEQGSDTADPPIEYELDVTDMVRSWLDGGAPNHGLAIAPVIDPSVDEGTLTRFQVYSSEHSREKHTPKLTVQVQP
jgi:Protein kinase domain/Disaggregatase related repeat